MKGQDRRGFELVEVLIVLGLLGILATVVLMNFSGSGTGTKGQTLKANLAQLRQAIDLYKVDHGWYPCTAQDWNREGDGDTLIRQLTERTFSSGELAAGQLAVDIMIDGSSDMATRLAFGPYLTSWPVEPFSDEATVTINTTSERSLSLLAKNVAASTATGGWYYEAKTGNICANLGQLFPAEYAAF